MNRKSAFLAALVLALPLAARAGDDIKPDKEWMGVPDCKKNELDCVWVDPSFSFRGKTIHVSKFDKSKAEPPKGGDYGELDWKTCDTFMQEVFENYTNDPLEKLGTKFVTGGSGELVMKGQILEFRYPKKGAAWGGWIGQAAGSGAITYEWKIVDKSGKTVAAAHHRILAGASDTMDRRVAAVHNDKMVDLVKKFAK